MTRPGFRRARSEQKRGGGGASGDAGSFLGAALFSQSQILQLMRNEFARARRHGHPLGCVLLQVDRMAQLVDLHGAALRDALRHNLSGLIRERTRGADLLGAWNDDRFLLLLPHTDLGQTRIVAERLHRLFQDLEIVVDGKVLALGLSVGIAACQDQQTMFFDTLVAQAEVALEHAAATGGQRIVSFGEVNLQRGDAEPQQQ